MCIRDSMYTLIHTDDRCVPKRINCNDKHNCQLILLSLQITAHTDSSVIINEATTPPRLNPALKVYSTLKRLHAMTDSVSHSDRMVGTVLLHALDNIRK